MVRTNHFAAAALVCLFAGPVAGAEDRPFVCVSPRDGRYFELTDGSPYIPIGLNIIHPATAGWDDYRRWFRTLEENGGNFVRVWLSHGTFDVEHEQSGVFDEARAGRIDELFALARRHNIRLKLCIEHFRHLGEGTQRWAGKPLHHVDHGGPATSTADFFDGPAGRRRYREKLDFCADRYGSDPIVFGWELWNEMNAIREGDWRSWTAFMLPELKRRFPENLVMQSLGSYDTEAAGRQYLDLWRMPGNEVLNVHRYPDLGARLTICHGPVDVGR